MIRGGWLVLAGAGAGALLPVGALAQRVSGALAVGGSSVQFAESERLTSATLTPSVALRAGAFAATATGSLAQVGDAGLSRQGVVAASLFTPLTTRGVLGELTATAGGSGFPDGATTAQLLGGVRGHWIGSVTGLWLGGGGGAMYDGAVWRDVRQLELGATATLGRSRVTAQATPSATDDTLRYADLLAIVQSRLGAIDLSASVGGRAGARLPIPGGDTRVWGSLGLAAWLGPRVAVTLSGGTYPVDVTQGFPAGEFAAVGLRWGTARPPVPAPRRRAESMARREARAAGVRAFVVRAVDAETIEIRVRAPRAQRVELMGDVTAWRAVSLRRDGSGHWVARLRSGAVAFEAAVRVDGGRWQVPPGADVVVDEFGGQAGRILVPQRM